MLIRLVGHHRNNPKSIDKLIAIKGLPEEWMFRDSPEGKELIRPWTADIDKNIPHDIRHLCEPMYITFRYPPIERGAKEIIEKKQILGIKLDFMMEPGRELWEKIERYLEGSVPRTEKIPQPVLCARDEHSPFATHESYRNSTGSLELREADVPMIDLTLYAVKVVERIEPPPALVVPVVEESSGPVRMDKAFKCDECEKAYAFEKVLRKHKRAEHKKEKVEV